MTVLVIPILCTFPTMAFALSLLASLAKITPVFFISEAEMYYIHERQVIFFILIYLFEICLYNMFKTIWRENCSLKMLLILSCPISNCQIDFFIFASKRIRLFLSSFHIVRYQCNDGNHTSVNLCVLFVCFQAYTYIYMIHFFQECITDINDCK